jgi:hypothetical protein
MKKETGSKILGILGNLLWMIIKFLWKIFLFALVGLLQLVELVSGQLAKWLKKDVLHINH